MSEIQQTADEVLYEVDGHVATITLNRPDRLNAISVTMLMQLGRRLEEADVDPAVRVVLLTGAGRAFCAGLDIKDAMAGTGIGSAMAGGGPGGSRHYSTRDIPTITLFEMDKPVIAVVNGAAAGYGLDLALGCDIRLVAESAKIITGFAKRGVVPESGGTWYLPRLLGWAKAAEIGFLGRDMTGAEAAAMGLMNKAVPGDDLLGEAHAWAEQIAGNAPLAVQAMKRLFRHGLTEDFTSHSHHVLLQTMLLFQSRDFTEGITSFAEGRAPDFQGR